MIGRTVKLEDRIVKLVDEWDSQTCG